MANGDPVEFPRLTDPAVLMARKPATAQAQPQQAEAPAARSQTAGRLGELMDRLNSIEDPFTRSIVQGTMEARMSDRLGFHFKFPDPAEEDLQKQRTMKEILKEQIETSKLSVQLAQAAALDLDPSDLARMGIEKGEDVFSTNPDKALELSNVLFENGMIPMRVTRGMLKLQGGPTNEMEATSMAEARAAEQSKSLETGAANIRHAETLGKAMAEGAAGEGVIGSAIESTVKGVEEQTGIDPIADSDEDRGSELFFDLSERLISDLSSSTGQTPKFIAEAALSGSLGQNLKDQLEGLDKSGAGELEVGKGDVGVTDTASFYLAASALNLFAKAGLSDVEGMRRLGLEYNGIDTDSVFKYGSKLAEERGLEPDAFFQSLGRGFLESMARKESELKAASKVAR